MKDVIISELKQKYGEEMTAKMFAYMGKILAANEHINLTAVREEDEFLEKHILDSLTCNDCDEFKAAEVVVDMGTGGGFPGIPLAITNPDKKFILADSLNKRLKIIEQFAAELCIDNIELLHIRAEDMGQNPAYREKADICVSRAVASLDVLSELCLPLVRKGGYFISYKGDGAEYEFDVAKRAISILGGKLDRIEKPSLKNAYISGHCLLLVKKVAHTPKRFPRKAGAAKKSPIR